MQQENQTTNMKKYKLIKLGWDEIGYDEEKPDENWFLLPKKRNSN